MKIKKEYIGAKVRSMILNKVYTIEEGKEDFYISVGLMQIFEEEKPVLIKSDNVKDRKRKRKHTDSDSERADNYSSPDILSV